MVSGTEQKKSRIVWGMEEIKMGKEQKSWVSRKDVNVVRNTWHEEDEGVPEIDS